MRRGEEEAGLLKARVGSRTKMPGQGHEGDRTNSCPGERASGVAAGEA